MQQNQKRVNLRGQQHLSIPQMLKIASVEGLLLFCMASLAVVLVVFCSCKSFFHEKELYFITLEDMLFKEVIKM